jgi:adhesin/invasin
VKWSVADPTVARIEGEFGQSVILRALRQGATTVTARSHGKSGSAQLVVTDSTPPPPPPGDSVATVSVSPDTAVAAAGDTVPYFATLRDANGNILSGRVITWSVSDSTVARVEAASGSAAVIRALAAGSALVTATSEGKSGAGSLFVR